MCDNKDKVKVPDYWLESAKKLYDSPEEKDKWCSYCGCEGGCNLCRYKEIDFEYTWCDYLTPCPYNNDINVGSYECQEKCEYCAKNIISNPIDYKKYSPCDYQIYQCIGKGKIICLR